MGVERFTGESGAVWSYDPEAQIGDVSGMGQVFLGAAADGTPVAVKRVRLRLGTEKERRRRQREVEIADVLKELPSEHVLPISDVGYAGDDLFIVMPLALRSLAAAIRTGDLTPDERFDALLQVTQGLVELAAASVLHRDLKSANVLEHEGRWRLADFGLARYLLEETGTYTFLGAGTFPYMAPELWQGRAASVQSDLYALGVIAYELLTGARPFPGPDEYYERQHCLEPPPRPEGVPRGIARIMLRLLAKNPADRPQDARAVLEDLQASWLRLSEVQEDLRDAAFAAEQRRSLAAARRAQATNDEQSYQERKHRAMRDLRQILEDAADLSEEALPGPQFRITDDQWVLAYAATRLVFVPWPEPSSGRASEELHAIVAGAVFGGNVNENRRTLVGNIVCKPSGDRYEWWLLRFAAAGPSKDVANDAKDEARSWVGFEQDYFFGLGELLDPQESAGSSAVAKRVPEVKEAIRRAFSAQRDRDTWDMTGVKLTVDAVMRLLIEALGSS